MVCVEKENREAVNEPNGCSSRIPHVGWIHIYCLTDLHHRVFCHTPDIYVSMQENLQQAQMFLLVLFDKYMLIFADIFYASVTLFCLIH